MKKLAIITTHPIQYNAPWFQLLAKRNSVAIKVFYTWSQAENAVKDHTFGKEIIWDIPLLEGYDYEFVENISKKPGSHHFSGIDCPTLIARIKTFEPNALLFFGWNLKSHLLAIHYFNGRIPVWFRGDSTLLDETKNFKTLFRRMILKKIYSYVDKVFYVGKASKAYFLKHDLLPIQLIYAPHAIDNQRFDKNTTIDYDAKASQWRHELGYKDEDLVVVFAGKFEDKKQPEFLIQAFEKANEYREKPIKLLLVGNGPLEKYLKEISHKNRHIKFLPFQNQTQMPLVYRLGAILCLPSKGPGESWGLVVNEAMASGKPVIVSDKVGCAEDLIKHQINGYCFRSDKQDDLIEILRELSLSELHLLGAHAYSHIQNYNFKNIVTAIENEMHKLNYK